MTQKLLKEDGWDVRKGRSEVGIGRYEMLQTD